MESYKRVGLETKNLGKSDAACPLITKKVTKAASNQCIHTMNDYLSVDVPNTI